VAFLSQVTNRDQQCTAYLIHKFFLYNPTCEEPYQETQHLHVLQLQRVFVLDHCLPFWVLCQPDATEKLTRYSEDQLLSILLSYNFSNSFLTVFSPPIKFPISGTDCFRRFSCDHVFFFIGCLVCTTRVSACAF